MDKLYNRDYFGNGQTPAINADNLNEISRGLSELDDRVLFLAAGIFDEEEKRQYNAQVALNEMAVVTANARNWASIAAENASEAADATTHANAAASEANTAAESANAAADSATNAAESVNAAKENATTAAESAWEAKEECEQLAENLNKTLTDAEKRLAAIQNVENAVSEASTSAEEAKAAAAVATDAKAYCEKVSDSVTRIDKNENSLKDIIIGRLKRYGLIYSNTAGDSVECLDRSCVRNSSEPVVWFHLQGTDYGGWACIGATEESVTLTATSEKYGTSLIYPLELPDGITMYMAKMQYWWDNTLNPSTWVTVNEKKYLAPVRHLTHGNTVDDILFGCPTEELFKKVSVTNNLIATAAGTALDAVQGKVLNDRISNLDGVVGIETALIDGVPNWRERGADTWCPFKSGALEFNMTAYVSADMAAPYGYNRLIFSRELIESVSMEILKYEKYTDGYYSIQVDACTADLSNSTNLCAAIIYSDVDVGKVITATKAKIAALSSTYSAIKLQWTLSDDDSDAAPKAECRVIINLK